MISGYMTIRSFGQQQGLNNAHWVTNYEQVLPVKLSLKDSENDFEIIQTQQKKLVWFFED